MAKADLDPILRRFEQQATLVGDDEFHECLYGTEVPDGMGGTRLIPLPRWRVTYKWIEFECGCAAERCRELVAPKPWDPIIFSGLEHQAVYTKVCHQHNAKMNDRVHFGGYRTFEQWYADRRPTLMGRAK